MSCYPVKIKNYNKITYWYSNNNYNRKVKLAKLNNTTAKYPKTISGTCIFEQDNVNKEICFNYTEIWKIFIDNYSDDIEDIKFFMIDTLKNSKFKYYTPVIFINKYIQPYS